jgi:hypothetical protein
MGRISTLQGREQKWILKNLKERIIEKASRTDKGVDGMIILKYIENRMGLNGSGLGQAASLTLRSNARNFLTSSTTISFSRRNQPPWV